MKTEEQKKINDLCRETLTDLEKCIDRLAEAASVALKNRAYWHANSLMRKAEMTDGLRAEVTVSIIV